MATIRMALYRLAASSRRLPSAQALRWQATLSRDESVVVSQTKIEAALTDAGQNHGHNGILSLLLNVPLVHLCLLYSHVFLS